MNYGIYDLQFQLTDAGNIAIGGPVQIDDLNVVRGVFTTRLDFQDSFGGADTLRINQGRLTCFLTIDEELERMASNHD